MEGPVGGRCFLAPALLHHPAGDHGAAQALGQQPEVGLGARFPRHVHQYPPTAVGCHIPVLCVPLSRFSHSPLIDDDDDDDEEDEAKEPMLNEAFGEQVASGITLLSCWQYFYVGLFKKNELKTPARSRATFISWLTRIQCGHHMQHGQHQYEKNDSSQARNGISPVTLPILPTLTICHLRCLDAPCGSHSKRSKPLLAMISMKMLQYWSDENEMKLIQFFSITLYSRRSKVCLTIRGTLKSRQGNPHNNLFAQHK